MKLSLSLDLAGTGEPLAAFRARVERIDRARPDFVLLAGEDGAGNPVPPLVEALVDAAWITGVLKSACVVAGLPALHALPFHVSRALSAIDFLSAGRSGWMPLTGDVARFDAAYGTRLSGIDAAEASARADDLVRATQALWDSWDQDALVLDKAGGAYLDSGKVRRVAYEGPFFKVMGPLNAARPPQGHPVLMRDLDMWKGSTVGCDVAIGSRETLAASDAPVRLLKIDSTSDAALEGAPAALAAGGFDGVHLYGARALDALDALDRGPGATAGDSTRATLGLARPANPYTGGAAK